MMNLFKLHTEELITDEELEFVPLLEYLKYSKNLVELQKREKLWAKDPELAYYYAQHTGKPFPLGESAIAKDPFFSLNYAYYILKEAFPAGEAVIAEDSYNALLYAKRVIEKPFPLGEKAISRNAANSLTYAIDVLHGPFKLGEDEISRDSFYSSVYKAAMEKLETLTIVFQKLPHLKEKLNEKSIS